MFLTFYYFCAAVFLLIRTTLLRYSMLVCVRIYLGEIRKCKKNMHNIVFYKNNNLYLSRYPKSGYKY